MLIKFPKDDKNFSWTRHIKNKMIFYGLSEQRLKRVLKSPKRVQEGIAPETIAVMQAKNSKKHPEEIWVMYRKKTSSKLSKLNDKIVKILMISAWRYPGVSKPGNSIPIPADILEELDELI